MAKEACLNDAIEIGLSNFPSLDPFNDILPNEERVDFEIHKMYLVCEKPFVNNQEDATTTITRRGMHLTFLNK